MFGRSNAREPRDLAQLSKRLTHVTEWPLMVDVDIAGPSHYGEAIRKVFAAHRMRIGSDGTVLEPVRYVLLPEPHNPYDPNAVAVLADTTHHVGHLPRELARKYAGPVQSLAASGRAAAGEARVWALLEPGGIVRARVTIMLPSAVAIAAAAGV